MRAQSRGDGDACPAQRGTNGFLSGPLKAAHPPTSKTRMASQDEHYCAETLVIIQDCANLLVAERACSQSRQDAPDTRGCDFGGRHAREAQVQVGSSAAMHASR